MQLVHEPIRPVRQEVLGELVFVEQWQSLMDAKPERLDEDDERCWLRLILRDMDIPVTQRHATVAASLVCWYGTNCGSSFLQGGKSAAAANPRRPGPAWVGAWAQENHRVYGSGGGYRTLEHILALDTDRTRDGLVGLWRTPDLAVDDFEVAEHVCAWLGSNAGAQFLAACEARIELLRSAAGGNAGRILPCPAIPGAVWVTPFFSRDSEELRLGGNTLGGWKRQSADSFSAYVNRLGEVANETVMTDQGYARAWVEARAAEFVSTMVAGNEVAVLSSENQASLNQ